MNRFKRVFCYLAAVMAVSALFAAESISITATPRYPWNGKVDLAFTIEGEEGTKYDTSFTAQDVIGGTNLSMKTVYMSPGVKANVGLEKLVPGTYNWLWDAPADVGDDFVSESVVIDAKVGNAITYTVKFNANGGTGSMANETFESGVAKALTANAFTRTGYTFSGWATSASGSKVYSDKQSVTDLTTAAGGTVNLYAVWTSHLYMVIDISGGTKATSYPISYLDAAPTSWGSSYKTTKLVLRRVSKGSNSAGGSMGSDMWVGIFEVTQKQYVLITGGYTGAYTSSGFNSVAPKNDSYPIEGVTYSQVDAFLKKLMAKCALKNARRPTSKEWIYACRAGTTTDLNSGKSLTAANANKVAWWGYWDSAANGYNKGIPHVVGGYAANKWGLYDMHGNVCECTTPKASTSTTTPFYGGSYERELDMLSPSRTVDMSNSTSTLTAGFRVFAVAE